MSIRRVAVRLMYRTPNRANKERRDGIHAFDLRRPCGEQENDARGTGRDVPGIHDVYPGADQERQEQGRRAARVGLDGDNRPCAQRQDYGDGRPVCRNQGATRRLLPGRGEGSRRGDLDRGADSGSESRVDRGAPRHEDQHVGAARDWSKQANEEFGMKYMITGAEPRGERPDAGEINRRVRYHQQKLDELLRARLRAGKPGLAFVSVGLGRETVTVKNRGGKHLRIDGPFPETKELVGGFNVMDFDSLDEAIEYTRDEHLHQSHVGEIRAIREFWWISQTRGSAASTIFMLSFVEDERAVLSLPESERTQIMRSHQAVGAEYVAQRAMLDQEPGLWVGPRRRRDRGQAGRRMLVGLPRMNGR